MSIGGERRLAHIRATQWGKLARELKPSGEKLVERIRSLASAIPAAVERALLALGDLDRESFEAAGRIGPQIAEYAVARGKAL